MAEDKRLSRLAERARALDAGPGAVRAAQAARRLLPGDPAYGDPLSIGDGQRRPGELFARYLSEVSQKPSAAREVSLGAVQVIQAMSESRGRGQEDVAILFTDLVEFSAWALKAGDETALGLLREVGETVEGAVRSHGGKVVKRLGDGLMAAFGEPAEAVAAACAAQAGLARVEADGYRPELRAGVHLGRPRKMGGDYLGVDVNIAARLVEAGSGNEILVSAPVCERLDEGAFDVSKKRWFRAKGAPKDLQVFSVKPRAASA